MMPVGAPGSEVDADVVVVGAGPVGLSIANTLGLHGVRVHVLERGDALIDYPRAIGMDDESMRSLQGLGLAEAIRPHLSPNHWMRFVNTRGRRYASIEPRTDEFGWSRRNAFNQPAVDAELLKGLARFPHVQVALGTALESFVQDDAGVTLTMRRAGMLDTLRCRWLVGCDGGRSTVRQQLGIAFDGFSEATRWLVIDIRNDPIGEPNLYLHSDPQRPHVSVALPDGVRRIECLVRDGETEDDITAPQRIAALLARMLPPGTDTARLDIIRKRVYTHSARLAERWRVERVLLAGDAAHLMPVWQGQGYNTGLRDATNLAWKLAYVVQGRASEALLDSYAIERKAHAKAMIDISVAVGRIFHPRRRAKVWLRDLSTWALNLLPPARRYVSEMRYKPMPFYADGVVAHEAVARPQSPVGRLFIQPLVRDRRGRVQLLDDVLGPGFALLAWGTDPHHWLTAASLAQLDAMGARILTAKPVGQLMREVNLDPRTEVIGDEQGRLKDWFGAQPASVVLIRPDRFVAGLAHPVGLDRLVATIAAKVGLRTADMAALECTQPLAELAA